MLNIGKPLPKDRAEIARQVKQRLFDEERRKRIFNPIQRTMGIDKNYLDRQIQEKKLFREQEQVKNQAYCAKLLQDCATSLKIEEQNKMKQKKLDLEILEFRKLHQTPETRREFDINDPLACKKGQPERIDDNDPRTTMSSGQRFEGESGMTKELRAEQIKQQRVWLETQIRDKKTAEEEDKNAELLFQKSTQSTVKRSLKLMELEQECKKKLLEANSRYNRALAAEQRSNKLIEEAENEEDKMAEVYNMITGDFLSENPEHGFNSALGPGMISKSLYKGLTPAMKKELYNYQAKQREELKDRKETLRKHEKDWAELTNMLARTSAIGQREMEMKRRELAQKMKDFNLVLADEKKKEQEFLNNVLYKTKASEEYFEQFNKTAR